MSVTRVRIRSGPWPERIGCVGTIVEAPAGYRGYPWNDLNGGRAVVVVLDNDPLTYRRPTGAGMAYTCTIARDDLEVLDA